VPHLYPSWAKDNPDRSFATNPDSVLVPYTC
jgi:hypothetical protein